MLIGLGTDIIECERLADVIGRQGDAFLRKVFTVSEITYCQKHKESMQNFSGRFAAKEAVAKALGCGIGELLSFLDIEIRNSPAGRPEVHMHAAAFCKHKFHLSISHTKSYATATCIVEKE